MQISDKYWDFVDNIADVEFLEGTTASGKTTVGGLKFILNVAESDKPLHVLAAKTTGIAEKNIIHADFGLMQLFPNLEYKGNGDSSNKLPHLVLYTDTGVKKIYVLGYDNADKWKSVLGSQFGCVMVDEINTANMEFVREVSTRNDYLLGTLNPDNPNLDIYKEFINCSRPLKKYIDDVPREILKELKEEPKPKWDYWFFSFVDNVSLSPEDIEKKKISAPKGTKLYKNKIQGLRGIATGLVFSNFSAKNIITKGSALKLKDTSNTEYFIKYSSGLDTSYSSKSEDTVAMVYQGITNLGRLITLDCRVYNNKDRDVPFAPSDITIKYIEFLDRNGAEWGISRNVFVDSADQATIMELKKYKRNKGCVYIFNNSYKKVTIIDRINLQLGWIQSGDYLAVDTCTEHIGELECYSWDEKKDIPEDGNDHTINACQYGWIPHRDKIGVKK